MRFVHSLRASAIALLIPITASAAGIQVIIDGKAVVFTDVQSNTWFATYVRQAAEVGIVNGYKDSTGRLTGKYGPSNNITLAEALKIAVEGSGYDEELYGSLVQSGMGNHWASVYVSVAKAEDFTVFSAGGKLNIDRAATRAEVASLFAEAFRVEIDPSVAVDSRYTDVSTSTRFAQEIEALSHDEVVAGDTDAQGQATGTFRPGANINRAEVAKMIVNARAKYGTPGTGRRPTEATATVVSYTPTGFSPAVLRVQAGTAVTFRNDSGEDLWVASDPHPTHTDLRAFDAQDGVGQGETYVYTFSRLGTFNYHNHLHPSLTGTIIVE